MYKFNRHSSLRGNILFLILIAVALFAALSYAVTSSNRSNSGSISSDKAKIEAARIVQYSAQIAQGVNRLLTIGGCSKSQLSFDYDINNVTGYENASAPSNYRCHIFRPEGGGVIWIDDVSKWFDPAQTGATLYGAAQFTLVCIENVGTNPASGNCGIDTNTENAGELILLVPYIYEDICAQILKEATGSAIIPQDASGAVAGAAKYQGSFKVSTGHINYISAFANYDGREEGCFEGGGSGQWPVGSYSYYRTLIRQ